MSAPDRIDLRLSGGVDAYIDELALEETAVLVVYGEIAAVRDTVGKNGEHVRTLTLKAQECYGDSPSTPALLDVLDGCRQGAKERQGLFALPLADPETGEVS